MPIETDNAYGLNHARLSLGGESTARDGIMPGNAAQPLPQWGQFAEHPMSKPDEGILKRFVRWFRAPGSLSRIEIEIFGGTVRAVIACLAVQGSATWFKVLWRKSGHDYPLMALSECLLASRNWILLMPFLGLFAAIVIRRGLGANACKLFLELQDCAVFALFAFTFLVSLGQQI